MDSFKEKTRSGKFPVLDVAHDIVWRNDIISLTTWKIKHSNMGEEVSSNKNTQVFHLQRATALKLSQMLHAASSRLLTSDLN